jgi:hypothetical protein
MQLLETLLRFMVKLPVQSSARGAPMLDFNQLQCYAYPDLCRTQLEFAIKGLLARDKQLLRDECNRLRDIF